MKGASLTLMAILAATIAQAETIDFESGFVDDQAAGAVVTPTNVVTFSVGPGSSTQTGFIAEAGDPITAFLNPSPGNDTPVGGGSRFSLTDNDSNSDNAFDYFFTFATPVLELSLDLYDYRSPEGNIHPGDTATLTAYSDLFVTSVGSDIFTVTSGLPDGNIAHLSIGSPSGLIRSSRLTFNKEDGGTAIDNIAFTTIPLPSAAWMGLVMLGCMGVGAVRRKFRKA